MKHPWQEPIIKNTITISIICRNKSSTEKLPSTFKTALSKTVSRKNGTTNIGCQLKAELHGGVESGISLCVVKIYADIIPVLSERENAKKCEKCGENAGKMREKC